MEFIDKFSCITKGMNRDEVSEILGPYSNSLTPDGFSPVGDSYRYTDSDGNEWYAHVWYRSGKVERTTSKNKNVASVALPRGAIKGGISHVY